MRICRRSSLVPATCPTTSPQVAAEELALNLAKHNANKVEAIHGDRTQAERQEIIHRFKRGSFSILVATDVSPQRR